MTGLAPLDGSGRSVLLGVAVATCTVIVVWAAGRPRVAVRGRLPGMAGPGPSATDDPDDPALLLRLRLPLALLAFVAAAVVLGGPLGVLGGLVAAIVSWRVLGQAESPSVRRRREQLARDLPVAVQLLASCLGAGGAVGPSLAVVAAALPGPLADELGRLHHRLGLGVDPAVVWKELSGHPELAALGRALGRAHDSGASIAGSVHALSEELRARARTEVEERARSVDVRAAVPLGVCFLPAFLMLGVVPLIVGVFSTMRLFG